MTRCDQNSTRDSSRSTSINASIDISRNLRDNWREFPNIQENGSTKYSWRSTCTSPINICMYISKNLRFQQAGKMELVNSTRHSWRNAPSNICICKNLRDNMRRFTYTGHAEHTDNVLQVTLACLSLLTKAMIGALLHVQSLQQKRAGFCVNLYFFNCKIGFIFMKCF